MAQLSTCCTLPQNYFFSGKDKLAGAIPTKDNNTPAVSHILTFIAAVALLIISALFSVA